MSPTEPWSRFFYTAMAAVAGAITALSLRKWQEMNLPEIVLTLFVGASFAWYVTPWLAHSLMHISETDARSVSGLTYLMGAGSNVLLPSIIRTAQKWVAKLFGEENSL